MVKTIIYGLGIILVVGLGLYMELSSGDYLIVEKFLNKKPAAVEGVKTLEPLKSSEKK